MLILAIYTPFDFTSCVPMQAQWKAHVEVVIDPLTWSYTLFNDEPIDSPNFIGYFTLDINAPITVTGTPVGWDFETDGGSYVLWFNTDSELPYPHDIAPGTSLGGFEIQSSAVDSIALPFALTAWDHDADSPGPSSSGTILVPSQASPVPEPASLSVLALGLAGLLPFLRRKR